MVHLLQVSRHLVLFFLLPASLLILAFFLNSSSSPLGRSLSTSLAKLKHYSQYSTLIPSTSTTVKMPKAPVYFFSHGGASHPAYPPTCFPTELPGLTTYLPLQPDVQYNTKHPVYPVLQAIGKEITQKVKPKAVVVFSAHWQAEPNEIHLNNAEDTDLIYE